MSAFVKLCCACLCFAALGEARNPAASPDDGTTAPSVVSGNAPTASPSPAMVQGSQPLDLSYIDSGFVAGIVARPRQAVQSDFGRTLITTAFTDGEYQEATKGFSEALGLEISEVDQVAILFREKNIASVLRIELPEDVGLPARDNPRAIKNNLKFLALAFHNYHDVYNHFPGTKKKDGELSWRVYILPFIEEINLYEQFDLDEDWDSDANKPLIAEMPRIYRTPGVEAGGKSAIHLFEESMPTGANVRFRDILDGSSNTIMMAVAGPDTAVEWTKPSRLKADKDAWNALGDVSDKVMVAMMDGSVRTISAKDPIDALVTPAGGEVVELAVAAGRAASDPLNSPTIILHATKPIDQKRALSILGEGHGPPQEKKGNRKVYYDCGGYAIWFPTSKSVVATQTRFLPRLMSNRNDASTLRDALKANRHADFIAVGDTTGMPTVFQNSIESAWVPVPRVGTAITGGWLAFDLTSADLPILKAVVQAENPKSARTLGRMLNGLLALGLDELSILPPPEGLERLMKTGLELLNSSEVEHEGKDVVYQISKPPQYGQFIDMMKPEFRLLGDAVRKGRGMAREMAKKNNLKMIGIAFHNHHDVYRSFGAADGSTADGRKGGLSWRVHLLPFLEHAELYDRFRKDEPWDSEHNKKLIAEMPDVFKVKGVDEPGKTSIHVMLGDAAPFKDGKTSFGIDDCIDGTSTTILAITAGPDTADFWTKPGGLKNNRDNPLKPFGKLGETFMVLLADGSVHSLSRNIDPDLLSRLITPAGREIVDPADFGY